jgi:hypothetical protein
MTILFAVFIFLIGINKPSCIHVNGQDFASSGGARFLDAYALSWTTFSTVVRFYEVVAAFLLYVETNILKFLLRCRVTVWLLQRRRHNIVMLGNAPALLYW